VEEKDCAEREPENHFTMKDVKKLKFKNTFMVKCIPALRG